MKTTAKAKLVKLSNDVEIRPVALLKEKLARSRLLVQLANSQRPMMDAVNTLLNPIIRQGHAALSQVLLTAKSDPVEPELHHAWFLLTYQRAELAWWKIDKCTLDQLASGYYGSFSSAPKSPLRQPSQSEFRLVKRLMLAAIKTLPLAQFDADELELELVTNHSPITAPVCCTLNFPKTHNGPGLEFYLAEQLLGLMAEKPSQYPADPDLKDKLSKSLTQLPFKVMLELGQQSLPVTALQQLKVGDILPMNLHSRCPVTVGKRPIFYATVHAHEGQMVAKLTQEAFQLEEQPNG